MEGISPMSSKFRPVDRDTLYLLPPSVQDWLPEDHLARFVVEIVDRLNLGALERRYGGGGKDPYHPSLLLGLLFYGYATGVFSSRKLERATYDSVAFRFVAANAHPDHDTIASFRKRFLGELQGLFVEILLIAREMGLLQLGNVSLDGTKVRANASKHKALSWGYAKRLEGQLRAEVSALLDRAEAADDAAPGLDRPGLDVPEELKRREERRAVIEAAQAEIERRARERHAEEQEEYEEKLKARREKEKATGRKPRGRAPKAPEPGPREKDQVNLTDAESRVMPTADGFQQAYNAQSAVDVASHLVVAADVVDRCNDKREVEPALAALAALPAALGKPEALLADAGYFSGANVERCGAAELTPYIAAGREAHNLTLAERLAQPPPCPEGADAVANMAHRLKTPEGRALYAKRKATVETVFGVIKETMGFRRFHMRGLEAARGEWTLACLAWNLKRMHALR